MLSLVRSLIDARDRRRAQRLQRMLGARRWLISWQPRPDGRWTARLSCPELPVTIARHGRTRCQAARNASRALRLLLQGDPNEQQPEALDSRP